MINEDGNGVDTEAVTALPPPPAPEPVAEPAAPKAKRQPRKAKAVKAAPKVARKAKAKVKKAKAKPRAANPATLDVFGLRKGSGKSKAAALYARKEGATLAEVKAKTGGVQYNVLKQLADEGHKLKSVEEVNKKTSRTVSRFFLTAKK